MAFDAIVLAGGRASRLGGVAKPQLELGGVTLLDHVLAAVARADRTVVVGPRQPTSREVHWAREDPPGSGPVAAIAAALPLVAAEKVLVLAADLPLVAPAVEPVLRAVPDGGLALLSSGGRRNYLAAAWRTSALRDAIDRRGDPTGASVRSIVEGVPTVEVDDAAGWGRDCDTEEDLAELRKLTRSRE